MIENRNNLQNLKELNGKTIKLGEFIQAINQWKNEENSRNVIIPMYQRNYKWNQKKALKLFSDLLEIQRQEEDKSISLFTLYINNANNEMQIIDGQQRFITLYLIFKVIGQQKSFIDFEFERDKYIEKKKQENIFWKA